jgi:phospholipase D1/2
VSDKPVTAVGQAWRWLLLCVYVAILVGLAMAWRDPSMRHWVDPQSLGRLGRELAASPLGVLAVMGGYVVAVMVGMPILVLTSVGALVFPPWPGMAYAMGGMLLGALVTYGIGRFTGAQTMDRWTKGRMSMISRHLDRRGLVTVIIVRVLPLAPFVMVNMVLGALRVRLRDFLLGSFIGLLPATVGIFLLMDRLAAVWRSPDATSYAALAACVVALIALSVWMRKKLRRPADQAS